ncbi:hypothetical protein [Microcoleus sp. herbarium2]
MAALVSKPLAIAIAFLLLRGKNAGSLAPIALHATIRPQYGS